MRGRGVWDVFKGTYVDGQTQFWRKLLRDSQGEEFSAAVSAIETERDAHLIFRC